jgi:hypothetical protein
MNKEYYDNIQETASVINYLKDRGYEEISQKFYPSLTEILFKKDNISIAITILSEEK